MHRASTFGIALIAALLLPPTLAQAGRPTMPALDADQIEKLRAGKLVLVSENPTGDKAIVTGLIEIDATAQEIWSVALSNEHILASSKAVKEVVTYKDVTGDDGVRDLRLAFMMKVGWSEIRFHSARKYHAADSYMVWALDPDKDNDIKSTEGSYSTWPGSTAGRTLFLYKARIETGKRVPEWLEEELTESSLKKYLVYVKKVAEE